MEALVAVGLAGNVVQFVQFSGQFISLAKEIKRKGAPSSLVNLRKAVQVITHNAREIVTQLKKIQLHLGGKSRYFAKAQ